MSGRAHQSQSIADVAAKPGCHYPQPVPVSLPALLAGINSRFVLPQFLNERRGEQWHAMSAADVWQRVQRLAGGMRQHGIQAGDRVAIMAPASPFWLLVDLAVMSIGAITVPLFPDWSGETRDAVCASAKPVALFFDGPEAADVLPNMTYRFKHLYYHRLADSASNQDKQAHQTKAIGHRRLMHDGDTYALAQPRWFDEALHAIDSDSVATIIYTSGSTGQPKGVPLTHAMLHYQVCTAGQLFPLTAGNDRALSCLPLAHVFERVVCYSYIAQGIPVYFADSVMNLGALLPDVQPTVMTVVPRILEKFQQRIVRSCNEGGNLKRIIGNWALGQPLSGLRQHIADRLIFGTIRQRLGGQLRYLIVGGAALAPATERFFRSIGIQLYQGYGMTEAGPVLAVNHPGQERPGTVGPAFPGVELQIAADGEILAKSPSVMAGYYNDVAQTQVTLDEEGWLHTGDLGSIDSDGFLTIQGRKKDLLKTAGGKMVAPVPIEQELCRSPLVDQAMVVADGRPYVSALLFADQQVLLATVGDHSGELDRSTINSNPQIRQNIEAMLHTVNSRLDKSMQVRKWILVDEQLSPQTGLITPTMKLRRPALRQHYEDCISELYDDSINTPLERSAAS